MRRVRFFRAVLVAAALSSAVCAMAEWKLDHEEDFARTRALDQDYWQIETGFIRNREKQYYAADNLKVTGGVLRIEARRERVRNSAYVPGSRAQHSSRREAAYTSGAIVSRREMRYGRIEVRARTPSGAGVWPAIWLLHESAGQYGEIDLFEAVGKHPDLAFATIHYGRDALSRGKRSANRHIPGFEKSWHVHSLEWTPERIVIALDGEPLLAMSPEEARSGDIDPLRQPMRLRINLALGGNWGGPIDDAALPAHFDIASIKVWRWQPDSPDDEVPEPKPEPSPGPRSKPQPAPGPLEPLKNVVAPVSPEPEPGLLPSRREAVAPASPEPAPERQEPQADAGAPASDAPLLMWGR